METLKEVIPTTASRETILDVILNPLRLPEWSLSIKGVQPKAGGYVAQTRNGPMEFYWFVDRQNDRATMQFDRDRVPVETTLFLYEQAGVRYVGEESSVSEGDRGALKQLIHMTKRELRMLRAVIERRRPPIPGDGTVASLLSRSG